MTALSCVAVEAQEVRRNGAVPNFQVLPPMNAVETVFKPGESVLIIGDSLVAGTGVPKDKSFPFLFDEWTPARVTADGKPGETSSQLLKRLPAAIRKENYRWVIVCTGGNNILRDQVDGSLKRDLVAIVNEIRKIRAHAVLMAIPDPKTRQDLPVYREIGSAMRVPVLENVGTHLEDRHFLGDGVHPNAEGYRVVAQELLYLFAKVDPRPQTVPAETAAVAEPSPAVPPLEQQKAPGYPPPPKSTVAHKTEAPAAVPVEPPPAPPAPPMPVAPPAPPVPPGAGAAATPTGAASAP